MNKALAINLPEPGKYVRMWKRLRSMVEVNASQPIMLNRNYAAVHDHLEDVRRALTNRINARAGLDLARTDEHWQLLRDQRKLFDFRNRIMNRGSGFETAIMRKRFPDVHAALRAPLD